MFDSFKEFFNRFRRVKPEVININVDMQEKQPIFSKGYNVDELKEYENALIRNTESYSYFGYLIGPENEVPRFFTEYKRNGNDQNSYIIELVHCPTPKTLTHCVKHLNKDGKKTEAADLSFFKQKCYRIAELSRYQEEDWDATINLLVSYMAQFVESEESSENC